MTNETTDTDPRANALEADWRRAQAGDEAAYRAALGALASRLRGYFGRRLGGRPAETEDLVQETLLAVHLRRGTHDPATPVLAWVHAIARHKWVDAWRRHRVREALHDPLDELPEALHPRAIDPGAEARHDVRHWLEQLPPAQRTAIVCTKLEGLSVAETAARSGQSEPAVKVNVHRGLKKLAALWRAASGEP